MEAGTRRISGGRTYFAMLAAIANFFKSGFIQF
jgi:hypothetical protein